MTDKTASLDMNPALKDRIVVVLEQLRLSMMALHGQVYSDANGNLGMGCDGTCSYHRLDKEAKRLIKELQK